MSEWTVYSFFLCKQILSVLSFAISFLWLLLVLFLFVVISHVAWCFRLFDSLELFFPICAMCDVWLAVVKIVFTSAFIKYNKIHSFWVLASFSQRLVPSLLSSSLSTVVVFIFSFVAIRVTIEYGSRFLHYKLCITSRAQPISNIVTHVECLVCFHFFLSLSIFTRSAIRCGA